MASAKSLLKVKKSQEIINSSNATSTELIISRQYFKIFLRLLSCQTITLGWWPSLRNVGIINSAWRKSRLTCILLKIKKKLESFGLFRLFENNSQKLIVIRKLIVRNLKPETCNCNCRKISSYRNPRESFNFLIVRLMVSYSAQCFQLK